jgi:preprotein translocase subunit YajC
MLIRPQKRRADQHRHLVNSLDEGDEVVTIGGVFGTVHRLGDDDVELEVAPQTRLRVLKSAIARRVTEDLENRPDEERAPEEEAQ